MPELPIQEMMQRAYESVLSDESLSRIRLALEKDIVFGFHLYYGGGRSGSSFVFSDFDAYAKYASEARVGDIFLVWSTAVLESAGLVLEKTGIRNLKAAGWQDTMLERVSAYLHHDLHEAIILHGSDASNLRSWIIDLGWLEELRALVVSEGHTGVIGAYPFTDIDADDHYLVKAKRPDADGNVPVGGAY